MRPHPGIACRCADSQRARAIPYTAREQYGLIWVAISEPAQPFPQWPDNAFDNPSYRVSLAGTYRWNASAGRVIENAMDFAHFNFVHKGYTELADGPIIKPHEVLRTDYGITYAYEDTRLRREYSALFPLPAARQENSRDGRQGRRHLVGAVGLQGGRRDHLDLHRLADGDTDTMIYCFVGRNDSLDRPDSDFTAGFDTIMEQDRVIVEFQRPEQIPETIREEASPALS